MAPPDADLTAADYAQLAGDGAAVPLAARPPLNGLSASAALRQLAAEAGPARLSLDYLLARLGDRAFGIVLVILAAPNCLPMPPGVSTFFGVAIMLISLQVIAGRTRLWVPAVLRRRSIKRADFCKVVAWFAPVLQRIERLCRPRNAWVTTPTAERLIGLVTLILGLVVAVPIPIIGQMPPAVAIGVLSVSLIERDGVGVGLGFVLAGVVIALNFGVLTAAVLGLLEGFSQLASQGLF